MRGFFEVSLARGNNYNGCHLVPQPMKLTWQDSEDIGIALVETHPGIDPLTVRFTDLHRWVTELADFKDDPQKSNEGILEAIQMAWYEEFQDQ
jgi:FeS assembly protein IscX